MAIYTCGYCKQEINGQSVERPISDAPKAPAETRHKNGVCENKNYRYATIDNNPVYRYTYRDVTFIWQPGKTQVTINGYGPVEVNMSVYDPATGKVTLPSEMRAFVERCEEWYSDMNASTCIHCDAGIQVDSLGVWRATDNDDTDANDECPENENEDHRPIS